MRVERKHVSAAEYWARKEPYQYVTPASMRETFQQSKLGQAAAAELAQRRSVPSKVHTCSAFDTGVAIHLVSCTARLLNRKNEMPSCRAIL